MQMSLYEDVLRIMEEELPEIGPYMLKKQMKDLSIEGEIALEDVPAFPELFQRHPPCSGGKRRKGLQKELKRYPE